MTTGIALPGPDGRSGPHVFVDDVAAPVLGADDRHHLERSLRLRTGNQLTVGDGAGSWCRCVFGPSIERVGDTEYVAAPRPALTVGFALTKGSKPELVVQKLTELGIDNIAPFVAERSVARWDDAKATKQQDRLERIAREASMQSRRTWIPAIWPLRGLADFEHPAFRAERGGLPLAPEHTTVLIGPEGGWSDLERSSLPEVHLGAQILRAETAAIAAATLMTALREQSNAG